MTRRTLSFLFALFLALPLFAAERRYDVMMATNPAGTAVVNVEGNVHTVEFSFNDRGRGPKLSSTIVVDENGIPTEITTTGNDYLKTPVDEHFTRKDGVATWKSGADSGHVKSDGVYVSADGTPEEDGLITAALVRAPNHRLPLLPGGEASLRKVAERTLTANEKKKHVTLYEVSGFGFDPGTIWLDDDSNLFANVSSWSQVILAGWGKSLPDLLKAQDDASAIAQKEQAARLTHKPKNGVLAVTNARLFDPATLAVTANATIVVRGNRIAAAGAGVEVPADATVIDAAGKTVIPGMWDMHQHFATVHGLLDIANGVTTGRDLANDTDFLLALRRKFDDGTAIGPHILMAGIIDGPGPFAGPTKVLVDTPEKAIAAVDNYAKLGYEQIKIYSSVKPELVPVIVKEAKAHHLRVSGHVPAFMRVEDAIRDGFDEIQHVNFLMLEFMPDVKETRNPARFIEPGLRGASLDFHSAEMKEFTELLLRHHTVIDPTLGVFEEMFTARKGETSPLFAPVADRMPPQVRRSFLGGGLPIADPRTDATYRASYKKMIELVGRLYRAGVPVVAGTDAWIPGFAFDRELEIYAQAGIPPAEILRIATLGAATVMHHEKESGSVTPGKVADFALIDGDPTTNISDVRRVTTVVKDGNVFETAEIDRELGIRP